MAGDVRPGAEEDVAAGKPGQLRDPQPGLRGECQDAGGWRRRTRADRGEAGVAGAGAVAAIALEVVQEAADERCVEVCYVEP